MYEKGLSRYFTRSPWVVVSVTAVERSVLSKVRFLDLNGMDLSLVGDNHDTQKKGYTYQYWHGEHLLSDPFPPQHNEFSSFLPTPNLHLHHTSKPKDGLNFRWESRGTNIIRLITSHLKPIYVVRHVEKPLASRAHFVLLISKFSCYLPSHLWFCNKGRSRWCQQDIWILACSKDDLTKSRLLTLSWNLS